MALKDYYKLLETDINVSLQDIKKSYRRLALEYHPDRNPGNPSAEEKFKEIAEAYQVLIDPQKRDLYDWAFRNNNLREEEININVNGFKDALELFNEFFSGFLGDIFDPDPSQQAKKGENLRYNLEITKEEAMNGVEVNIEIPHALPCPQCFGNGARTGSPPRICPTCNGKGKTAFSYGFLTLKRICRRCRGKGTFIDEVCPRCKGKGEVQGEKTIGVQVPQGVRTGYRLKLSGWGKTGENGGPKGDLYIVLNVRDILPNTAMTKK